jgi:hypothetical protein
MNFFPQDLVKIKHFLVESATVMLGLAGEQTAFLVAYLLPALSNELHDFLGR